MKELSKKDKDLEKLFKKEVLDRAKEIDFHNEYHWLDLTIGWALAKGLSPEGSKVFANYIRYHTDLG